MADNCSVTLAPITEHDHHVISQWSSSASWTYATGSPSYLTPDEVKGFIAAVDDNFLMVRTADGQTLGAVSWVALDAPGNFSIGIIIGDEDKWGAGFGVEASLLIMRYLFDSKNAHRIEFKCGAFNLNTIEYFCLGVLSIEGILRDYYFIDGTYQDAIIASILRDEFYALAPSEKTISDADRTKANRLLKEHLEKNPITVSESGRAYVD